MRVAFSSLFSWVGGFLVFLVFWFFGIFGFSFLSLFFSFLGGGLKDGYCWKKKDALDAYTCQALDLAHLFSVHEWMKY